MKKNRGLALLCALLLIFACFGTVSFAAQTDTVYVRKHVSMVYDNSGSMSMDIPNGENLKWSYASYAAQIFAGLLNETDSLSITFMHQTSLGKTLSLDMAGDRQKQLDDVKNATAYASGATPLASIAEAMDVLLKKGLLSDAQIGNNQVNAGEQFWLVLTTDGLFEDNPDPTVLVQTLKSYLEDYSNLQLVYFGIGAGNTSTDKTALDLGKETELTAFPNFTAVYAERQEEIVSTMRDLSNRISGRYDVEKPVIDGNKVSFRISGETSPLRNVAILAQKTEARIESISCSDGTPLILARSAVATYPYVSGYENVPQGTKGGYVALITCKEGKLPPAEITLTFSEPVDPDSFSVMYEPAIYLSLTVQRLNAAGQWETVKPGDKLYAGQTLRVSYDVCEDGTNNPIDPDKLPGASKAQLALGGEELQVGKEFQVPAGNSQLSATVSLMDGAYSISTVRTLYAAAMGDFTVEVTDPLVLFSEDLANNTDRYIDFTVYHSGKPATADLLVDFRVESGDLAGQVTNRGSGVFRFVPRQEGCPVGSYQITLYLKDQVMSTQTVTVKEDIPTYSAKADSGFALFTNELASNQQVIRFYATAHRAKGDAPVTAEEAQNFHIEAKGSNDTLLEGKTDFREGGEFSFLTQDSSAAVGDYTVTLYYQDTPLASANITVMQYDATFTAEVFYIGDKTVDRLHLWENQNAMAFVVYADGEPCSAAQLNGMLTEQLELKLQPKTKYLRPEVTVGMHDNKPAVIVRPTAGSKLRVIAWLQRLVIAWGGVPLGELSAKLDVIAPKGTSVTGNMEIVNDPANMWIWRIIGLAILTILIYIAGILYCNKYIPRMYNGKLSHYTLTQFDSTYTVVASTEEIGSKFYFYWRLTPEVIKWKNMEFSAGSSRRRVKLFALNRRDPEITVKDTEHNLSQIYYQGWTQSAEAFMNLLRDTYRAIPAEQVNRTIPKNTITTLGRSQFTITLQPGSYMMKKTQENGKTVLQIWTFRRLQN